MPRNFHEPVPREAEEICANCCFFKFKPKPPSHASKDNSQAYCAWHHEWFPEPWPDLAKDKAKWKPPGKRRGLHYLDPPCENWTLMI